MQRNPETQPVRPPVPLIVANVRGRGSSVNANGRCLTYVGTEGSAVAKKLAALMPVEYLKERAARESRKKFERLFRGCRMLSLLRSTGCLKNWKAGKEKAKEAGMREAGIFEPPRTAEPVGQTPG